MSAKEEILFYMVNFEILVQLYLLVLSKENLRHLDVFNKLMKISMKMARLTYLISTPDSFHS